MLLIEACEKFIRKNGKYNVTGHQWKHMFNATCPFTDTEGLRLKLITNQPFDYIDYTPTLDNIFLDEPTLSGFRTYVDLMFAADQDDMSYFKMFRHLLPDHYKQLNSILARGKYSGSSPEVGYKIPICLIPVMELHAIERYSRAYTVKTVCLSLERTLLRLRLNSFFLAVTKLLQCTEDDLVNILYEKGVLPSVDFQLISSQKELTIGLSLLRSCGDIMDDLGVTLQTKEQLFGMLKPKYCVPNTNMCQALQYVFIWHPIYSRHLGSLFVETEITGDGKGRLRRSKPNKKGCRNDLRENFDVLAAAMKISLPELLCQ